MQKNRLGDWIFIVVTVINLLVFAGMFFLIKTEGGECMASPLTYGAKQMEDSLGLQVYGEVRFISEGQTPTLMFSRNNVTVIR